jgi:hypothetical protein
MTRVAQSSHYDTMVNKSQMHLLWGLGPSIVSLKWLGPPIKSLKFSSRNHER